MLNMCLKEALLNSRLTKTKGLMLEKENLEQDRREWTRDVRNYRDQNVVK